MLNPSHCLRLSSWVIHLRKTRTSVSIHYDEWPLPEEGGRHTPALSFLHGGVSKVFNVPTRLTWRRSAMSR